MHRDRPLVLVVDDDNATRCNVVNWLSEAGYRCVTTDNIPTALWYLRRLSPVVTIVDIGQGGERVHLASFLAADPAVTSLVLTGSESSFREDLDHVAFRLPRPCGRQHVVDAVRAARLMQLEPAPSASGRLANGRLGAACS